ncbi:hypothetical protein [Streptomyces erythrochromogenes]|uniref:hypothetical protein n=1 Tax=Streptomyces erythrochromogenes TaxID=285574 RepID=UPI0037D2AC09
MTTTARIAVLIADYEDAVAAGDISGQLDAMLAAHEQDLTHPDGPRAMAALKTAKARAAYEYDQAA